MVYIIDSLQLCAMKKTTNDPINKRYIITVSVLTFVLPLVSYGVMHYLRPQPTDFSLTELGKWFIFYAVGFRLTLGGVIQVSKPAFTAKTIFRMESMESYPVIRELGFANLCFGLIGLISLFFPAWRIVSAFGSGLYYGLAAVQHGLKKNAGVNEKFALYTNIIVCCYLMLLFGLYV